MAIAVTSIGQTATGSPLTIGSVTVPAGSLIVVCICDKASTGPAGTLSDGGTNTYTAVGGTNINGSSANGFGRIWYAYNSAPLSGATLTYTKAGTNPAAMSAFYATGIQVGSDPIDSAATATGSGSSNAPTKTSGTPASSGDLFVAMVARSGTAGAFTQDAGHAWATPPVEAISGTNGTTDARVDGGTFVNSGTGTLTYAPTYAGTVVGWAEIIVAFKAGGTVFTQTVSVTSAGAVSVQKSVAKAVAVTGSGAVTMLRSIAKAVLVTSSGAVTTRRAVGKTVAVTSSGAVSVKKSVGKIVAVTSSGAVSIAKFVSKTVLVTSSGAVSIITKISLIVQPLRRALYLRGFSFWKGKQ